MGNIILNTEPIFAGRAAKEQAALAWVLQVRERKEGKNQVRFDPEQDSKRFFESPVTARLWVDLTTHGLIPKPTRLVKVQMKSLDISGGDFGGIDLSGAMLDRVNAHGTKFAGSNLTGASLVFAVFDAADMTGADLTDTKAKYASFSGSLLEGATLRGADLRHTNMSRAWLSRADLEGARMQDVNLEGAVATEVRSNMLRVDKVTRDALNVARSRDINAAFATLVTDAVAEV